MISAAIMVILGLLFVVSVLLVIDDAEQYDRYQQLGLQTGKCPFCGDPLLRSEYFDKDGKKLCLWCPDCEFDVTKSIADTTGEIKSDG